MQTWDVAIVGAGMAGASLAWELTRAGVSVLLLERESQPGTHSTGRSAALFIETYGTEAIRALTRASRAFYETPPAGFADTPILTPRGVAYVATSDEQTELAALRAELQPHAPDLQALDREALLGLLPCLRPEVVAEGLLDPGAADIDVHALHQGYLRGLRQQGGTLRCDSEVLGLRREDDRWLLQLPQGATVAARRVVNAAGAWADVLAQRAGAAPVGLVPKRRTAFTFPVPAGMDATHWPAAIGVAEDWYFKPDAGQLLGSPANADPVQPHDVVAEELDVAMAIARIEEVSLLTIRRPTHTWAGLRSFVADGEFVIGEDDALEGFFWLAAQGGYGIQSAAGYALLARNLLLGEPLDERLRAQGITPAMATRLAPARFR
ncbi:MAG: FAD-dependent oxidoreductase [Comamonas sp. SCN 67-35]|uniref:NAD(P)/FAD-dependent oxidoreductase n=1 Tax=unclassified Comamonas TaxID=2638500 RepID=UPI000869CF9B|nr:MULTISPECIES: FAD-dependent oxidoreductase [unclassified Comamonas]MBN9328961.1 FAD-binding oxidoreductase [Comamonas sp.]ODU38664.1 MAG: FAD-dependent oxidoreductase [Comamonas sp. SCN 67-35]OJX01915.1 MAG: FAD-dependent oxidoreductase [Burkholderiales bacterium 66-26]